MIGQMNRRIKLRRYTSTQAPGGGATAVLEDEYEQWAQVQQYAGNPFANEQQGLYNYDKKFTFRAYPSRAITAKFLIDYDGQEYAINELQKKEEGKLFYWVARCTKVDNV